MYHNIKSYQIPNHNFITKVTYIIINSFPPWYCIWGANSLSQKSLSDLPSKYGWAFRFVPGFMFEKVQRGKNYFLSKKISHANMKLWKLCALHLRRLRLCFTNNTFDTEDTTFSDSCAVGVSDTVLAHIKSFRLQILTNY